MPVPGLHSLPGLAGVGMGEITALHSRRGRRADLSTVQRNRGSWSEGNMQIMAERLWGKDSRFRFMGCQVDASP